MKPHTNTFSGFVESLDAIGFASLQAAVAGHQCREGVRAGTLAEAAARWRPDPVCPAYAQAPFKDGLSPSGGQRHLCPECGGRFSTLTVTVLEYCDKDLATWVSLITLMCFDAPLDLAAEKCGIAHVTAFGWRRRVFATVDGHQDRL